MINLSSKDLSTDQINLLERGLKFTPTPSSDTTTLASDLKQFGRKLRLREFFYQEEEPDDPDSENSARQQFRNKSMFNPPRGRDRSLDLCIDSLNQVASNLDGTKRGNKHNLPYLEHKALDDLKNDQSLVIKEADKGGAVVVMDTSFYAEKMKEMLEQDTYNTLQDNADQNTMKKIKQLLSKHNILHEKEYDFLTNFDYKTANFYGLPKIHKSKQIQDAINQQKSSYIVIRSPDDLPFRPIVAGPACPTSRLSKFIDHILQPFTKHVQSYVRDDIDFLNKLPTSLDQLGEGYLATFDATSLYTNIDHNLGLQAIQYWIEKHPSSLLTGYNVEFIKEAVQLILENNTFQFDDQNYLQVSGTAMGTQMAPTYATLTVGYVEQLLHDKINAEKGKDYSSYVKEHWKRYLDDCFIYWPKRLGDIGHFLEMLNNMHPKLHFTMNIDKIKMPFLDILIKKKNDHLITDIYHKDTDGYNYVPFNSCHPHHTKTNIPYNLARRICTIVSDKTTQDTRLHEMSVTLQTKGYPKKIIKDSIAKAKSFDIVTLRSSVPKTKCDANTIIFTQTHNPNNPQIHQDVERATSILSTSSNMRKVMDKTKIVRSFRQPPNLKKLLTSAKFNLSGQSDNTGVRKCTDKRCKCCPHMKVGKTCIFENGTTFEIKSNMDCNSKCLLYVITCSGCNGQYIGETGDVLRNRVRVHRQHIRDPKTRILNVSEHIATCSNDTLNFTIVPFYKMNTDCTITRREKEDYFIKKFNPSLNNK